MHEPTPDSSPANDHTWPTCVTCKRNLWDIEYGRYACRPCQDLADKRLTAINTGFVRLNTTTALVPGIRRSNSTPNPRTAATGGGRTHAPLPLSVNVLNLTAAGGIATRLTAIEDSWRQALGWAIPLRTDGKTVFASWRANPVEDIPLRVRFLSNNLLWACSSYESVADDLDEIRRLAAETAAALSPDPRPGRVHIGTCPTTTHDNTPCGAPLTATAGAERIRCGQCGSTWDGMGAWRQLRQAQQAATATTSTPEPSGAAA